MELLQLSYNLILRDLGNSNVVPGFIILQGRLESLFGSEKTPKASRLIIATLLNLPDLITKHEFGYYLLPCSYNSISHP